LELLKSSYDDFRSAIVTEPRGCDAMVGALLCKPVDRSSKAGVIFFNNVGYLGMCGHGTIGLVTSLAYLNLIEPGSHWIETPVGSIRTELHDSGDVTVENVPSYRHAANVIVDVPRHGPVRGDIAWGGNWFFLTSDHHQELSLDNLDVLTDLSWRIRRALRDSGITGANGQEIDHIELLSPSKRDGIDCRNFVLCPGRTYDRSPCGTGTSAKLACLFADGKFKEGDVWRQESIIGSVFEGSIKMIAGKLHPRIRGSAYVYSEAQLVLDERDPFCFGIHR
jgi:4-hydroxyproline epimerase